MACASFMQDTEGILDVCCISYLAMNNYTAIVGITRF